MNFKMYVILSMIKSKFLYVPSLICLIIMGITRKFIYPFTTILLIFVLVNSLGILSSRTFGQTSLPPNAVELRCGMDIAGTTNMTLDGVDNLPVGFLCEVRNATGHNVIATFSIGYGTEGPPGVFKEGQFDYLLTVGPNPSLSPSMVIYIRVYDASSKEDATHYGDSQTISIKGGNMYSLPGWELTKSMSSTDVNGDDNADNDTDTSTQTWKNPILIAIIIVIVIFVIFAFLIHKSKPKPATTKTPRRRNYKNK